MTGPNRRRPMESLRGLSSSPERVRRAGHRPEVDPLSLAGHPERDPRPAGRRAERARRKRAPPARGIGRDLNLLDDRGKPRWTFDPLPFVITPDEWSALEAGLVQRAALLDAILADLYGPQTLLDERLVPPMLVHANRHFLRACRVTDGKPPARHLGQYAVDLVRLASGTLARAGRPHRGAVGRGLCARDPPRAGAQPARGLPLDPGAPRAPVRRPLAQLAGRAGAAGRGASQHGRADAGLAVGDLLRARLSLARARRAAGRGRRPGGARRRGADQDAGRPAPRAHAAAPARFVVRRSARAARRQRRSASPASSRRRAPARSRSPTRWARAWSRRRR